MATVLLTYDIKKTSNTIHSELKSELINNYGYSAKIQSDSGTWFDLPNTCLRKVGITRQQAAGDFTSACKKVNAIWEKYIAVEYTSASFDNQNV